MLSLGSVAAHAKSSIPTAQRQCGSMHQKAHYPLLRGTVEISSEISSAHCPEAVRECVVRVSSHAAPEQRGSMHAQV